MAKCIISSMNLALFSLIFLLIIGSGSCGLLSWMYSFRCYFTICCDNKWIIKNFTGLQSDLQTKLHGQHLVQKAVLGHIKAHFTSSSPPKALALAFHGPTGVGKNFVSHIIAKNMYKDGMHSKFVHLISATRDFQHASFVDRYKIELAHWIEESVKICERSMFIFDEIDKLPPGLLDVTKPYLDYYEHIGGIDYRKAVFIFLSNTGTSTIMKTYMEQWRAGNKREDLKLQPVEGLLLKAAFNDNHNGGFWHGQIIISNLVTGFIPFLPLEKRHVRECIKDDMMAKRYFKQRSHILPKLVEEVLSELSFLPEDEQLLSSTGCKRISEKVDYVMIDIDPHDEFHKDPLRRSKDEM